MRFRVAALVACALLCALPLPVPAQTLGVTSGTINGVVTDQNEGALPGATVTVSGPALMGVRTVVTDERGAYRFPGLAPGEYVLTFELAGFGKTVREHVQVAVGFTATVDEK